MVNFEALNFDGMYQYNVIAVETVVHADYRLFSISSIFEEYLLDVEERQCVLLSVRHPKLS